MKKKHLIIGIGFWLLLKIVFLLLPLDRGWKDWNMLLSWAATLFLIIYLIYFRKEIKPPVPCNQSILWSMVLLLVFGLCCAGFYWLGDRQQFPIRVLISGFLLGSVLLFVDWHFNKQNK